MINCGDLVIRKRKGMWTSRNIIGVVTTISYTIGVTFNTSSGSKYSRQVDTLLLKSL